MPTYSVIGKRINNSKNMRVLLILFAMVDLGFATIKLNEIWHERQKRGLIFQPGLNWVQMVAGIGLPTQGTAQSITFGPVVKSYFALPTNSTQFTDPQFFIPASARRKSRSLTRWKLYEIIVGLLKRYGVNDSKACLLHAICETAKVPFNKHSGLINEIMHIILTPSLTNSEENFDSEYISAEKVATHGECWHYYPECNNNWFSVFTNIVS